MKNFISNKELVLSDEQHLGTKNIVWANIQPGYVTIITLLALHFTFYCPLLRVFSLDFCGFSGQFLSSEAISVINYVRWTSIRRFRLVCRLCILKNNFFYIRALDTGVWRFVCIFVCALVFLLVCASVGLCVYLLMCFFVNWSLFMDSLEPSWITQRNVFTEKTDLYDSSNKKNLSLSELT